MNITNQLFAPAIVKTAASETAAAINREYELGQKHFQIGEENIRKGLEHYRKCGELLNQQKSKLKHGEWLQWLKDNVKCSERQARRYMELAKSDVKADLYDEWQRISGNTTKQETIGELLSLPAEQLTLDNLAVLINYHHEMGQEVMRESLHRKIETGEQLLELKTKCTPDEWNKLLEDTCKMTRQTAKMYMDLALLAGSV